VVAGAREMMRYRRNRASTLEPATGGAPMGQPQQQQPVYSGQPYAQTPQVQGTNLSNTNPNSGWATYQAGAKPVAVGSLPQQQMPIQSSTLRKAGTPSTMQTTQQGMGWPGFSSGVDANSRPKSAGITGTTGGGLMSSLTGAGRPSSSTQMNNGGVPNSQWGGAVPQPQQIQQQQQQGMAVQSANTLSYGSLKNRFLSGSTGSAKATGVAPVTAAPTNNVPVSNPANKSKLFSLAR